MSPYRTTWKTQIFNISDVKYIHFPSGCRYFWPSIDDLVYTTGPSNSAPTDIAEILVFDAVLNDSKLAKVNYYLSKKWGLTTAVDSDSDEWTDAKEIKAGTSPVDNDKMPQKGGHFQLNIPF